MILTAQHNTADIVRRLRKLPDIAMQRVNNALNRGAQEVARDAKYFAPKAFSTLTNAIKAQKLADLVYEVDAGTNYARAVEEGTGPGGKPSVQAIEDWMRVKHIEGSPFAIARSIAQKGTPAHKFMEPAYLANKDRTHSRVSQAIAQALNEGTR